MASNFGAALAGQFLVSRPPGGVAGEGADLFPTASDYHLVCLQHDGAASLAVDGAAVYEGGLSVEAAAGEFFLRARGTGDEREKRPAFHHQHVHALPSSFLLLSRSLLLQASNSTARPSC